MPVSFIAPEARFETERGDVVVCIPLYRGHEHFVACLDSVLAHTPVDVAILVCDDASPDARSRQYVEERAASSSEAAHQLLYARREVNVGFPANVNGALASCAPADVVVLNSDCVVAEGWLEDLRAAAYCDDAVATATALTNNGTILSVPDRGVPRRDLPAPWAFADAAAAVRAQSLRLRPRLITAIGHCVYVRRSALELVGDFDLAFSPGYGEEVDFSQRCLHRGLHHVAADDVLVLHHGGASFSRDGTPHPVQAEHEVMLATRYPYYHDAVRASEGDLLGPLPRALAAARRALTGLTVIIDARGQNAPEDLRDTFELAGALARSGAARVTLLIPLADEESLASPIGVDVVRLAARAQPPGIARADVVHLPGLPESEEDLRIGVALGDRLIVSHPNLVAYDNPSYFPSFAAWDRHRDLTRTVLGAADRVIFPTEHARRDALAEDLLEGGRASVVRGGVEGALSTAEAPARPPRAAAGVSADGELVLVVARDRSHENRIFALRLLAELQRRHQWQGTLVLAGARVTDGSSAAEERELLAADARLAAAVVDAGAVSEAERAWLLQRASLLIYPAIVGGSGRLPFVAAGYGVPCLWPQGSWLGEVLASGAGIVEWDPACSADAALALIRDRRAREDNLRALRAAASKLSWDSAAERMLAVYRTTCEAPPARRPALPAGTEPDDHLDPHPVVARVLAAGYRASHWMARPRGGNGR